MKGLPGLMAFGSDERSVTGVGIKRQIVSHLMSPSRFNALELVHSNLVDGTLLHSFTFELLLCVSIH